MNFRAEGLMQYLKPVGSGPSVKTWPKWPPHFLPTISILFIPRVLSSISTTEPSMGFQKLGQPVLESYLFSLLKTGSPQSAVTKVPGRFSFKRSVSENGASVPCSLKT